MPEELPPNQAPGSSNRVRDHLANERTFLAWIRTALGLIGLGFVLARMGLFLRQLAAVGATPPDRGLRAGGEFIVSGVVFLVLGTILSGWAGWLYDRNRRAIDESHYEPARHTALALTAVVVAGGIIIVILVLWRMVASH